MDICVVYTKDHINPIKTLFQYIHQNTTDTEDMIKRPQRRETITSLKDSQLAKMKKSIPDMSLP